MAETRRSENFRTSVQRETKACYFYSMIEGYVGECEISLEEAVDSGFKSDDEFKFDSIIIGTGLVESIVARCI